MISEAEERVYFEKHLHEVKHKFCQLYYQYWNIKQLLPVKIPQIGGRELDFFRLYKAVTRRGGAQQVSNNKLWKEIVNEFGLPTTCTSASFTLRNHYTRFLLGYEQKFFFGKEDDDLPKLQAGRIRKQQKEDGGISGEEEEQSSSESSEQVKQRPVVQAQKQVNPATSQLGQQMQQLYRQIDKKEEIIYIKKTKMFHQKGDLKRIQLAFQSRMHDEMVYALNSLLLYSVNATDPFLLDHGSQLLENITKYLEESIKNLPSLSRALKIKQVIPKVNQDPNEHHHNYQTRETTDMIKTLNVLENYNYSVSDIILFQQKKGLEISPIEMLKKRKKECVNNMYDVIGEAHLLEQVRTIFQILRNLCYQKSNELAIAKDEKLCQLIIQLFLLNCDTEISKSIMDIISNISKHISLQMIPDQQQFLERIFEVLHSDVSEELESAVDTLRNLIAIPENEPILEKQLNKYIESLTRLLLYSHGDIREGVLEFLCFLSDLKMSTKVILAKEPKLLMRLIGLLGSGIGKSNEKITKLAALTLNNIAIAPASRIYLLPFEKDLFIVSASDESVSKLLGDILSELDDYELETHQN